MKFNNILTAFALLIVLVFSSCGDSDKNIAQIGVWFATNVSRSGCTNPALDGIATCPGNIGFGDTYSCVELNMKETSYTLDVRLDSNTTNEVGTYTLSDGNIHLCPTSPIGSCYNVPVINASNENMTISMKRSTGCTAVIDLVKIR